MQPRNIWILVVLVLAVLAFGTCGARRGGRGRWLMENYDEAVEAAYDCSQSWATCPNGKPYCYWGDKDYNKGKCCEKPWSGPDGCQDPIDPATGVSMYA